VSEGNQVYPWAWSIRQFASDLLHDGAQALSGEAM
jgi:hypothetical protein